MLWLLTIEKSCRQDSKSGISLLMKCFGRRDKTEILSKKSVNTIQSVIGNKGVSALAISQF